MITGGTNGHLTSKDISHWLVEGPTAEAEAHVDGCWSCQAKLAEAREPLAVFRTAVVAWSEDQPTAPVVVDDRKKSLRGWSLVDWMPAASVAFALLVLAVFLVENGSSFRHSAAQPPPNQAAVSDTVLMDQVDEEVSETVPDAMAPLTDLVAWDSSESTAAAKTVKPVVKKKAGLHSQSHEHGTD